MKNDLENNYTAVFLDTVKETNRQNLLITKGDRIIVALSGGADSVSLLDGLCKLSKLYKIKVAAAHLNHMIRGAEADADEAFAAELCTKLGVPFFAERLDVPAIAKRDNISLELAGRNARYEFFKALMNEKGYNKIATGHNKNDLAETVLMRIMRGSGTDGLGSVKYKREDGIIRPILDVDRKTIEGYCEENGLKFCTDKTNSENEYTRNRIRNELIPFMEEKFNPKIVDALCSLSRNAADDSEFINGYAKRLYKRLGSPMPKRTPVVLDIESVKLVESPIRFRLIRQAAREEMGDDYELQKTHFEAVNNLLEKETGACAVLPKNLKVTVKYGWLEFTDSEKTSKKPDVAEFCYEIDVENDTKNPDINIKFCIAEKNFNISKNQMIVNYDLLNGQKLFLRNRRIGDKFVYSKDGKSKKLKNYFIDEKIPVEKRSDILLLCTEKEIVAVIGYRVSEKYKLKTDTKRGLVITYEVQS